MPATPEPRTYDPVCRQQQWSPALELTNVEHLVGSASLQALHVTGENHMAQTHRCTTAPEAIATEHPADQAARDLQDPITDMDRPTAHCCRDRQEQAHGRHGKGPEVADETHGTILCAQPGGPRTTIIGSSAPSALARSSASRAAARAISSAVTGRGNASGGVSSGGGRR